MIIKTSPALTTAELTDALSTKGLQAVAGILAGKTVSRNESKTSAAERAARLLAADADTETTLANLPALLRSRGFGEDADKLEQMLLAAKAETPAEPEIVTTEAINAIATASAQLEPVEPVEPDGEPIDTSDIPDIPEANESFFERAKLVLPETQEVEPDLDLDTDPTTAAVFDMVGEGPSGPDAADPAIKEAEAKAAEKTTRVLAAAKQRRAKAAQDADAQVQAKAAQAARKAGGEWPKLGTKARLILDMMLRDEGVRNSQICEAVGYTCSFAINGRKAAERYGLEFRQAREGREMRFWLRRPEGVAAQA